MIEKWKDFFRDNWPVVGSVFGLIIIVVVVFLIPSNKLCNKSHEAVFTAPRGESGAFDKEGKALQLPPFKLIIRVCDD